MTLIMALWSGIAAATDIVDLVFSDRVDPSDRVVLHRAGGAVQAQHQRSGGHPIPLTLGSAAGRALREAVLLRPLDAHTFAAGPHRAFLLLARYPSPRARPSGYCGAGDEDVLFLMGMNHFQLALLDRLPLQSCLEAFGLASDGEDDPLRALQLDENEGGPPTIRTAWLNHPKYRERPVAIRVTGTKLVVEVLTPP